MKAMRVHSFDGPEALVFEELAQPSPAAGQVLVKVHASSINPIDRAVTAGVLQPMLQFSLPFTPGLDLAGVVAAVGAGVTQWAVGDAVYGYSGLLEQGAYAEYVAVSEHYLLPKPSVLSFAEAAVVPLVAVTAWQALFEHGALQAGQTVLILGAGGGVGSFAVQLAALKGARVIAVASTSKLSMLHELGAHDLVDYTTSRFEDVAKEVDLVIDAVGNDAERAFAVLKPSGMYVAVAGQPDLALAAQYGVRASSMQTQGNPQDFLAISALIEAGKLKPIVSEVVPLAELPYAFSLLDQGHTRGKIAIQVAAE